MICKTTSDSHKAALFTKLKRVATFRLLVPDSKRFSGYFGGFEHDHPGLRVTEAHVGNTFVADGSKLIITHWVENEPELMLLPLEPGTDVLHAPKLLLDSARHARVSPDGRWVAYISKASGREEVYLRSIDRQDLIGREIPVTRDGCGDPIWYRGEGAAPLELWYSCQSRVYSVVVSTAADVSISKPRFIADATELFLKIKTAMAFLPDGRILAGLQGDNEKLPTELNVVVNWFTELEQRLAAAK